MRLIIVWTSLLVSVVQQSVTAFVKTAPQRPNSALSYANDRNHLDHQFILSLEKLMDRSSIRDGIIAQARSRGLFLSEAGRTLREVEMKLLESLADSDAGLEELVHLWTTEREAIAAMDIMNMQSKCSEGLMQEEERLIHMARKHPGWAEPMALLATLLYHKGPEHLDRSAKTAHSVLELKPWHFEALNLMVNISHRQNKQAEAEDWKRRALPPLDQRENRKAWVEWALGQARAILDEAEHTTAAIRRNEKPRFIMMEAWE